MTVAEALASVEFIVGRDGKPRAAVLDIAAWETLMDWLKDMEDLTIVRAALPRLWMGLESRVVALGRRRSGMGRR